MSFAAVLERLQKLENPYPGLRPFETHEGRLFFGRDQQIAELVGRLERSHFVAVVGVSGSGKSSLVRAGLIPALERSRVSDAGARWRIAVTRPAGAPYASLAADLSMKGFDTSGIQQSSHGLIQIARQLSEGESLLVVIDQFEELFRYKDRDAVTEDVRRRRETAALEAAEFVQLLLAASRHHPPVYVVLTMRSDYLGDCAEFRDLPELLNDCQYLVPRLTREQRKEAIEGPLGRVEIAPSLVQRMLNDAGDEPDQLPILQHALMRTWGQWRKSDPDAKGEIELEDYEATGGFGNALNHHADELLAGVREKIAATIFKRLSARGRGDRERRDPATLAELWDVCGADTPEQRAQVNTVIDRFRLGEATFLTPRDGTLGLDTYIDITHESLIRLWNKLRDEWLPEEKKSADTFLYLMQRTGGENLAGLDLTRAEDWDRERNRTPAWAKHYADEEALGSVLDFIRASRAKERRRVYRDKLIKWIAVGAAVIFGALAAAAWYQWNQARRSEQSAQRERDRAVRAEREVLQERDNAVKLRNEAQSERDRAVKAGSDADRERTEAQRLGKISLMRQLAAQSELVRNEQRIELEPATLLAAESMFQVPGVESDRAIRESTNLLPGETLRLPHQGQVNAVAISTDGRWVATGGDDHTARVFEASSGKEISRFTHQGRVNAVVISTDGRYVATGSDDHTARVFEASSGKEISHLTHEGRVYEVVISADGHWVATGSDDQTARVFETSSGKEISRVTYQGRVYAWVISADRRWVATGSDDHTVRILEASGGKEISHLTYQGRLNAVVISADGRKVATGSDDDTARVFEASSGKEISRLTHGSLVSSVAFSEDGNRVATASYDDTARVFEAASGVEVSRLVHRGAVQTVAFSANGRYVATASNDGTSRVFEAATGKEVSHFARGGISRSQAISADGCCVVTGYDEGATVFKRIGGKEVFHKEAFRSAQLFTVTFSPDGRYLATGGYHDEVRVFEAASGKEISILSDVGPAVFGVAFSGDGRRVAIGSYEHSVRLFDLDGITEVVHITQREGVSAVAVSMDGRYIAAGAPGGGVRVFETASRKEISRLAQPLNISAVAFSNDRRYVVVGGAGARVFETTSAKEVSRLTRGKVHAVAFSPDGRYVATGDDHTAQVFEARTGKEISRLAHQGPVKAAAFSADGRWVATGSDDHTARVFEAATGKEASHITVSGPVRAIRYTAEGRYLMTASIGTSEALILTRHLLRPQDLIDDACSRLTRNLSPDEWKQYVGPEVPYHKTCPSLP